MGDIPVSIGLGYTVLIPVLASAGISLISFLTFFFLNKKESKGFYISKKILWFFLLSIIFIIAYAFIFSPFDYDWNFSIALITLIVFALIFPALIIKETRIFLISKLKKIQKSFEKKEIQEPLTEKKTNKKSPWITLGIIIGILILATIIINLPITPTEESVAKCIGENSIIYIQTGCHFCEDQLKLFGENQKYLNIYNCNDDNWRTCREVGLIGTPTWVINEKKYTGKYSIENLQKLTGC